MLGTGLLIHRQAEGLSTSRIGKQHPGKLTDSGAEGGILTVFGAPLHPEVDDRATATARVATPEVLLGVNLEALNTIIMEGAETLATLIQSDKAAHEVVNAHGVLEALRQIFAGWNRRSGERWLFQWGEKREHLRESARQMRVALERGLPAAPIAGVGSGRAAAPLP